MIAKSVRNARVASFAWSLVLRTKWCWTAWRPGAQRPGVLDQRRETVEHPFGTIKQWMNQGAFLMRGLEKVRAEFSLTALAYNLRRVLNSVGFAQLIAAVAA